MSISIKVDLQGVKDKFSESAFARGKYEVASQILLDAEEYIPLRGGSLRASGYIEGQGTAVVYNTVYARAQFYGTNGIVTFRNYTTPGTGKRWDEKVTEYHSDKWAQAFLKGAKI